jgi:hypothetical protein
VESEYSFLLFFISKQVPTAPAPAPNKGLKLEGKQVEITSKAAQKKKYLNADLW